MHWPRPTSFEESSRFGRNEGPNWAGTCAPGEEKSKGEPGCLLPQMICTATMEQNRQKFRISLPHETIVEILRHFTRKELRRKFYLVDRQFHGLSLSGQVPAIQIVKRTDLHWKANQREQVPGPFIRFDHVDLTHTVFQEESMLKFLPLAHESFIGCRLCIRIFPTVGFFPTMGPWKKMSEVENQMLYLMENVFCNPSSVTFCNGELWIKSSSQILKTNAVSNCNNLAFIMDIHTFTLDLHTICIENTIRFLRDWLQNSNNRQNESSAKTKRFILHFIPRPAVLRLTQRLKQEFEEQTLPSIDFVIAFIQPYYNDGALDEDQVFSVTNSSTNMRLSLFNCKSMNGCVSKRCKRFSRLWHRRIVSKDEDAAMFSDLEMLDDEDYGYL
ncbi:hypothetical protein DdX_17559 [Ditylenchus destructor]|uniref:F-box domain-containing protein n=1 Tax=Ditylenchus destructor TaxID=166010 RepID=A0AAD4MRP9_9BILA|nr:hypothetical protein DdX_17559 [Ditylenchus destructor]